eukprot:185642-Chlamydomonas_euryale.AAC.1
MPDTPFVCAPVLPHTLTHTRSPTHARPAVAAHSVLPLRHGDHVPRAAAGSVAGRMRGAGEPAARRGSWQRCRGSCAALAGSGRSAGGGGRRCGCGRAGGSRGGCGAGAGPGRRGHRKGRT